MMKRGSLDQSDCKPAKMAKRETSKDTMTLAHQTVDQPQQRASGGKREAAPVQTSKKKKTVNGAKARNVQQWAPEEDEIILQGYLR